MHDSVDLQINYTSLITERCQKHPPIDQVEIGRRITDKGLYLKYLWDQDQRNSMLEIVWPGRTNLYSVLPMDRWATFGTAMYIGK